MQQRAYPVRLARGALPPPTQLTHEQGERGTEQRAAEQPDGGARMIPVGGGVPQGRVARAGRDRGTSGQGGPSVGRARWPASTLR